MNVATWLRKVPIERVVPWAALLPVPTWFLASVVLTEPAAWHATYRRTGDAHVVVDTFEREMSHLWSGKYFADPPGGLEEDEFVADFEACLHLGEPATVPFMLVADADARFLLDGQEVLGTPAEPDRDRRVLGKELALDSGHHHLRVEFKARRRPRVGLLASFDGNAPQAVGSGRLAPQAKVSRPKSGSSPCGD